VTPDIQLVLDTKPIAMTDKQANVALSLIMIGTILLLAEVVLLIIL
jgi:hypothetical protein